MHGSQECEQEEVTRKRLYISKLAKQKLKQKVIRGDYLVWLSWGSLGLAWSIACVVHALLTGDLPWLASL